MIVSLPPLDKVIAALSSFGFTPLTLTNVSFSSPSPAKFVGLIPRIKPFTTDPLLFLTCGILSRVPESVNVSSSHVRLDDPPDTG